MFTKETLKRKYNEIELEGIYHVDEVANFIGMHPKSVKRLIKERKLEALLHPEGYVFIGQWIKLYLYNLLNDTDYRLFAHEIGIDGKPIVYDNPDLPLELQLPDDEDEEENDELINLV